MMNEKSNYKWARIVVIPIIALFNCLTDNHFHLTGTKSLPDFFTSLIYVTCYWQINRLFFAYLIKKLPPVKSSKQRIGLQVIFVIGFVLFAGILLDLVNFTLPGLTSPISFLKNYSHTVEKSLFCLGLITIIFECIYFFGLYDNARFENKRLKEEALVTQLNLLKRQISPYFL